MEQVQRLLKSMQPLKVAIDAASASKFLIVQRQNGLEGKS